MSNAVIIKCTLVITAGIMITLISLVVGRLGAAYKCVDESVPEPYVRDVRGLPFVYVQRSLESTPPCNFVAVSTGQTIETSHKFEALRALLDVAFWSLAIVGTIFIGKKVEAHV